MTPERLATQLGISGKSLRGWLRRTFPRPAGEKGAAWTLTAQQVAAARQRWGGGGVTASATVGRPKPAARTSTVRKQSDEAYVIDLCDHLLGEEAMRQHRFDWLVGDPCRDGAGRCLPVDAFYSQHRLVVEYRERQHDEAVPFFDGRPTVSGIGRGEQRRLYDLRREVEIPKHRLRLLVIGPKQLDADKRGRLRRNAQHDRPVVARLLGYASAPRPIARQNVAKK